MIVPVSPHMLKATTERESTGCSATVRNITTTGEPKQSRCFTTSTTNKLFITADWILPAWKVASRVDFTRRRNSALPDSFISISLTFQRRICDFGGSSQLHDILTFDASSFSTMAEAAQQPHLVEIDPDFEPLSRPRSCTWPLPRPEFINPGDSNTSSPVPSVKQEPAGNTDFINNLSLLEETEDYTEQKPVVLCTDFQCQENCVHQQPPQQHQQQHNLQHQQHPNPQLTHHHQQQHQQVPLLSSSVNSSSSPAAVAQRKSSSSRRNAWGNMSYADLITKAIESSPENRLTLSQIYDWMVKSVPYFKDKGDSNSSAGWKVCLLFFF